MNNKSQKQNKELTEDELLEEELDERFEEEEAEKNEAEQPEPEKKERPKSEKPKAERHKDAKDDGKPSELDRAISYAEDCKRKWYAVSAEYDNYRKRNNAAVAKAYADGVKDAILKLLPIADNFGYALDSAGDEKTKAGIEKIIKNFKSILATFGVEEIGLNVGDEFDESLAEAVMSFPCGDGEEPNRIKQVLKKGYKTKEKVIRFAQVTVTI